MPRTAFGFLTLLLVFAVPAAAVDPGEIHASVRAEMARQKIPGVGLLVVEKGQVLLAQGYGLANIEWDSPVTADTVFQSGSIAKQFTAVAVMLQVEAGKLGLDDPLSKWIPGTPVGWKAITIRHLLTHTSGIPPDADLDGRRDYSDAELAKEIFKLKLKFAPGAHWSYSNAGYDLLGFIVEKASGRFYGDVLQEQVFNPLGMKTARVISERDIVRGRAAGYTLDSGVLRNQEWISPTHNRLASGSLYLSVNDYAAWDRGLRAKAILTADTWREIYAPVRLNDGSHEPYGFGWQVMEYGSRGMMHRHSGGWQGFRTNITRIGPDDLTVVVLCNSAQAEPNLVAQGIIAMFMR